MYLILIFIIFLGDNGLLSKKGIKAFLTELTRISDFLGESNSFGSQYVDSTVAQCLHVANQKLLNEDTFFKWFFKEPQIIVWLPTFYRMNVAKSVRHDVRCAHCRAQIVGLRLVYFFLNCFVYTTFSSFFRLAHLALKNVNKD